MKIIFTAVLLLAAFGGFAQRNCSIKVNVKNVLINKGDFYFALYNKEGDFMKTPYSKIRVPASRVKNGVIFTKLPAGEYAVTIFQDLNSNKALDKVMSVPVEPYGLSNNVPAYPTYSTTKFTVTDQSAITVSMHN
ncbi:DUF2141 domain-containing protein [Chitinophaga sancti]|uniref:DUF2141 domain-containing protein n=1 Tax=Chitinophaga sancti TaxID=1004 RepID=A0A1K1RL79_9BACT|nr:DUF2141 domain-containing protein [Chitinophaga sancti]WQD60795.1 DUF2141 domain-containing protein [Chitinophaga sancti]WQG87077.1 DUF2141 domain-containing protein [Chitinophaga sancti]SFW72555.1 Uncharacterized conserved protein, DUF2141 family [Chitinophaga sancti]